VQSTLLTGKLTGNFSNLGLFLRFWLLIDQQIQSLAAKFPNAMKQGVFLTEQGIFSAEQGILGFEQGIGARTNFLAIGPLSAIPGADTAVDQDIQSIPVRF
jgi:hypothetical protein